MVTPIKSCQLCACQDECSSCAALIFRCGEDTQPADINWNWWYLVLIGTVLTHKLSGAFCCCSLSHTCCVLPLLWTVILASVRCCPPLCSTLTFAAARGCAALRVPSFAMFVQLTALRPRNFPGQWPSTKGPRSILHHRSILQAQRDDRRKSHSPAKHTQAHKHTI